MSLRIYGATSGYVDLDAPAVAGSASVTLPGSGTLATQAYADGLAGLTLITTQAFSAAASVSINNCFSATYANYRVVWSLTNSNSSGYINVRMRASGSDDTTSNYSTQELDSASTTTTGGRSTAQQLWAAIYTTGADVWHNGSMEVYGPQASRVTSFTQFNQYNGSTSSLFLSGGLHNVSSSFDGITFYVTSGSITGTIRVYGYKN